MFEDILRYVSRIPKGRVATYGEVAAAAGHPHGSRQVAWALRGCSPAIPWHRVIGKSSRDRGKILLRGEKGVEQHQRLSSEGVKIHGVYVDMKAFRHDFPARR